MIPILPKVLPINELKNTAQISKTCHETDAPIIITKNGYADLVLMSAKVYEETFTKMQTALLINEALDEISNGAKPISGEEFFSQMRKKYG